MSKDFIATIRQGSPRAMNSRERAKAYAKDYLRFYVERGDTVTRFCREELYHVPHRAADLYVAQHAGAVYFQGRLHHLTTSQVGVKEMGGQPCLYIFEVAELFRELGTADHALPLRQPSLWEEYASCHE